MNDLIYMQEAIDEAKKAYDKEEVPIGAVVVRDGRIIARAHNLRELKQTALAHAEILAIQSACKTLGTWRLEDCTLYVTLEPCPMCAGAIIQSRIKKVVYGALDQKHGVHKSQTRLFDIPFNHSVEVVSGVLAGQSTQLLKNFFNTLRKPKDSV